MSFMKTVGLSIGKFFGKIMNWLSDFNIVIKICMEVAITLNVTGFLFPKSNGVCLYLLSASPLLMCVIHMSV